MRMMQSNFLKREILAMPGQWNNGSFTEPTFVHISVKILTYRRFFFSGIKKLPTYDSLKKKIGHIG